MAGHSSQLQDVKSDSQSQAYYSLLNINYGNRCFDLCISSFFKASMLPSVDLSIDRC